MFEKNLAKMLKKDDTLKEDTKLIADKMWRASQSNHMKKKNPTKDLEDLGAAFENNCWDKNRELPAKMWGNGKEHDTLKGPSVSE